MKRKEIDFVGRVLGLAIFKDLLTHARIEGIKAKQCFFFANCEVKHDYTLTLLSRTVFGDGAPMDEPTPFGIRIIEDETLKNHEIALLTKNGIRFEKSVKIRGYNIKLAN